jgi:hypothetical protein
MRKKLYIFLAIVSVIAIIFIALPFLLAGYPVPFFFINNYDTIEHDVAVEIFNLNNESLFEQTYKLAPQAGAAEPKSTWMVLKMSIPSQEQQEYIFVTTLDNNTTDIRKVKLGIWSSVGIRLDWNDAEGPLCIGIRTI